MAAEWFLADSGGAAAWALTDTPVADVAADPPTAVSGSATGGSTSTTTWTPAVTGGTPTGFDVAHESPTGSGTWVTSAGAANPTGAGVSSFAATGQTPGMQVTPRVRALRTGFSPSAWTVGAAYCLDVVVGGGGEIPGATAPLTGEAVIGGMSATGTMTGGAPSVLSGNAIIGGVLSAASLQGLVLSNPTGYYRRNAGDILSGRSRADGAEVMLTIAARRRR